MIYVGVDDTDTREAPGTNQLVRALIQAFPPEFRCLVAVRHQLLFDPRVPYTSKNSSASILVEPQGAVSLDDLAATLREGMRDRFVDGSDPGLCLAEHVPDDVTRFGRRCQKDVVSQKDARRLAERHGIHLEGLGGTEDGVIGALAAVGLLADGNDGRVVQMGHWPDDLSGSQDVSRLFDRGVHEVRVVPSGQLVREGRVDVGKHLRPNYRNGIIVLFVEPAEDETAQALTWRAVRFS